MHEFKEFVDNCSQESPMSSQKSRILAYDVHDVRSNDGLIILTTFLLAKS